MANEDEVARLKKELKEMADEFRKYRDKTKEALKAKPRGDVEGQAVYFGCEPCISWTDI